MAKKDKYEELGGEFVNEADLEEEMDQEDLELKKEEASHFEEEELVLPVKEKE